MDGVMPVATYTRIPIELPSNESSGSCRWPLLLPPLDLIFVIEEHEELKLPAEDNLVVNELKKLRHILWFQLLLRVELGQVLFLQQFKQAVNGTDTQKDKPKQKKKRPN